MSSRSARWASVMAVSWLLAAASCSSESATPCTTCAGVGGAPAGSGGTATAGGGAGGLAAAGSAGVGGGGQTGLPEPPSDGRVLLREGWKLAPAAAAAAGGAVVSSDGFDANTWHSITVPATVLAGLVQTGQYPDLYVGENIAQIPSSDFATSWWYRTDFEISADDAAKTFWLGFDGLNFSANIWLNGQQIAGREDVAGTFRIYRRLVQQARAGRNVLAVEVFPPEDGDLGLNWWDWNIAPPDQNMGIWRDVYLRKTGPVAVQSAFVTTKVPSTTQADVTVVANLENASASPQHAVVELTVEGVHVQQEVDLAANQSLALRFTPEQFPELRLQNPRLWWPHNMGSPELSTFEVKASVAGSESDRRLVQFGVREVTASLSDGHLLFHVNGKPVLIRGGGWATDMLLRSDPARTQAELSYVRDLGLNALRLEGKPETEDFYSRADALGILLMPGWMCCDKWERWAEWQAKDHVVAAGSMRSQAELLRNHPSVIDFLIGSDKAPPADVEAAYLAALQAVEWSNPISPAASNTGSPVLGNSGMKMTGPYDWIAPSYWYVDTDNGGAFGFNSETGPGPAIPEIETVQKFLSSAEQQSLWQEPDATLFHAGPSNDGFRFHQLSLFNEALAERLGAPESLTDYVRKAQLMNYEGERAQFEAFSRNKYQQSTGVIHWLLNNAWPSLIWHLYDYSLLPAASYFGAKKANESLHIQYSYDDASVFVINHSQAAYAGLTASIKVFDLDGSVLHSAQAEVSVAPDAVAKAGDIPALSPGSSTYFVRLELVNQGQPVSTNWYWLSTVEEQIDFENSDWYHAPTLQFADFSALSTLASTSITASAQTTQSQTESTTVVTLNNQSDKVAFFVRLKLTKGDGGEAVVPVLWQDNYVSLAPGEQRTLSATCSIAALGGSAPKVELTGWNVAKQVF